MRIKALLLLPALLAALPALARDFEYTYEGQTLTYTVIDETAKTVMTKQGSNQTPGNRVSGELIIPEIAKDGNVEYTVTIIGDDAFSFCNGLTSVTFPESITKIGENAFWTCSRLNSVTIGNSVTEIGKFAFRMCLGLKDATIGESVTTIGEGAFFSCINLASLTIGKSVQRINENAFSQCGNLNELYYNAESLSYSSPFPSSIETIVIGDGVKYLPQSIFSGLDKVTSVTIPNSVTSIGGAAFNNCSGLIKAEFGSIEHLCGIMFGNRYANPLYYAHNLYINGKEINDLVIPESVTSIGDYAFKSCSGLTSVTIGNSVETIGYEAFDGCTGLTEIYSYPTVPPVLGEDAFAEVTNTIPIYVPAGSADAYRSAEGWDYFTDFREMGGEVVELAVALSETALELKEGETATLTATIGKPEDMAVAAEEWTSSDEAVATVDDGTVTAVAEGKATITYTVTFSNGETRTATCDVTVIKQSGIEAISAEAGTDAEYFTLQGIRVKADKLAPGVYIRRSGSRTDKVLVK